jgi:deoxyadenosine/deoxycytidine kinase
MTKKEKLIKGLNDNDNMSVAIFYTNKNSKPLKFEIKFLKNKFKAIEKTVESDFTDDLMDFKPHITGEFVIENWKFSKKIKNLKDFE